jgi:hypothetical protein
MVANLASPEHDPSLISQNNDRQRNNSGILSDYSSNELRDNSAEKSSQRKHKAKGKKDMRRGSGAGKRKLKVKKVPPPIEILEVPSAPLVNA